MEIHAFSGSWEEQNGGWESENWAELCDEIGGLWNLTSLEKTILGRLSKALTMLIISGALHFFPCYNFFTGFN